MGLPIGVGTAVQGSLTVDSASYIWGQWQELQQINQRVGTHRVTAIVATGAILRAIFSTSQGATEIYATGGLNAEAALTANALQGFTHEARRGAFVNYQLSATVILKKFWVSESDSEASI